MKTILFVLSVFAVFVATAQITVPTQLNVFKNGTYFIMREGSASISNYEASVMVPMRVPSTIRLIKGICSPVAASTTWPN
ncbi:MAG: hypothetical protein EOM06_15365, partial [Sphingobacteriia bacterium]|nr:hypothetical protein [Sphingobacteriia bacterium]